jgi:Xaa-Pro aminopeptidase
MYSAHRARLVEELTRGSAAAVIPTSPARLRNGDCEYRFRPDSDFWYLTGFAEPEAVLVLLPGRGAARGTSTLFLNEKDPEREVWTGRRLGVEAAPGSLGVDRAYPIAELWNRLPKLLEGCERVYYPSGLEPERDRRMLACLRRMRADVRSEKALPTELIDPGALIGELRLIKSEAELECMRRAAAITAEAHLAAMAAARPGMAENEIDALLTYTFLRRGSSGSAYANIVAGGANACVLHYVTNDMPLQRGDLLLVDAGCEWQYYASDVTRTYPVSGTFSEAQRALYEVVLDAQKGVIASIEPGVSIAELHEQALRSLVAGLLRLGLLEGELEDVIEEGAYRRFYMHRTSHWLGLDVHDSGAYVVGGRSRRLEPGMVLTVEPGLYVDPGDESVEERWRGIGIRIEDDVLVTSGARQVLSAAVPKAVDEVEAACRGRTLSAARS